MNGGDSLIRNLGSSYSFCGTSSSCHIHPRGDHHGDRRDAYHGPYRGRHAYHRTQPACVCIQNGWCHNRRDGCYHTQNRDRRGEQSRGNDRNLRTTAYTRNDGWGRSHSCSSCIE